MTNRSSGNADGSWHRIWNANRAVLEELHGRPARSDEERALLVAQLGAELLRADRITEGLAVLNSVRTALPSSSIAKTDFNLGNAYLDAGNLTEAARRFAASRDLYAQLGDGEHAKESELGLAEAMRQLGRLQDALEILGAGKHTQFIRAGVAPFRVFRELALLYRDLGQLVDAADYAEQALADAQSSQTELLQADCRLALGTIRSKQGRRDDAIALYRAAEDEYSANEGPARLILVCRANRAIEELRLHGNRPSTERQLTSLAQELTRAGDRRSAAIAEANLGRIALSEHNFGEAVENLQSAFAALSSEHMMLDAALCQSFEALAWLGVASESAYMGATLAAVRKAKSLALTAFGSLDDRRYIFSRSDLRAIWAERHAISLAIALRIAADATYEQELIAELVETARAQAIPAAKSEQLHIFTLTDDVRDQETDVAEPPLATGSDDDSRRAAALAALGELQVQPPPVIVIGGRTRLAPATQDAMSRHRVDITKVLSELAGTDAWWWGTWFTDDRLWYAVITGSRVIEAGGLPWDDVKARLGALDRALPQCIGNEAPANALQRALSGPLATDPRAEDELARRLGAALLPRRLITALLERTPQNPLPLVVSMAPELSRIPVPLLGIGEGRRVIDNAIVRYAPSAALCDALLARRRSSPHDRGSSERRSIEIAIGDPSWDLPGAYETANALSARTTLVRASATKEDLLRILPHRRGAPGVVVYAGHAFAGFPRAPATAALCLFGFDPSGLNENYILEHGNLPDEWLSARSLLSSDGPRLYDRLLLAACSSGGASQAEWLGLAPAAMWAGASTVAFTLWDLFDDRAHVDLELAELLASSSDPAADFRHLQRDMLDHWRAAGRARDGVPDCISPLVFGSYAMITLETPEILN